MYTQTSKLLLRARVYIHCNYLAGHAYLRSMTGLAESYMKVLGLAKGVVDPTANTLGHNKSCCTYFF